MTKLEIISKPLFGFSNLLLLLLLACCCSVSRAFRHHDDFSSRPITRINGSNLSHQCNLDQNYRILHHHRSYYHTNQGSLLHATAGDDDSKLFLHALTKQRGGGGGVKKNDKGSASSSSSSSSFLERHAFWVGISITTVKAILADLLTQLVFEGKNNVPWNYKRTLVFGAFGLFYQGMVQYVIVNLFWERLFPGNQPRAVVCKICGMNLLSDPLLFMPTFYIFKQFMMMGGSMTAAAGGSVGVMATIKVALLAYKANCFLDWRNSWMIWFPGHAVTYGVLPMHQRIPWMAFLSFFYMCVLSYTRGGGGGA